MAFVPRPAEVAGEVPALLALVGAQLGELLRGLRVLQGGDVLQVLVPVLVVLVGGDDALRLLVGDPAQAVIVADHGHEVHLPPAL